MKGRKPKLPHLRVIAGRELGSEREAADRLVDAAPLPQPPAWLSEEAQDEWRRVVPMLTSLAILTALDMATFSAYCQAWAIFKQASEALARMASSDSLTSGLLIKTTNGNAIQNPLVGTINRAATNMLKFASELALTPVARARLHDTGYRSPVGGSGADRYFD